MGSRSHAASSGANVLQAARAWTHADVHSTYETSTMMVANTSEGFSASSHFGPRCSS
jgi:hypothetical protein